MFDLAENSKFQQLYSEYVCLLLKSKAVGQLDTFTTPSNGWCSDFPMAQVCCYLLLDIML